MRNVSGLVVASILGVTLAGAAFAQGTSGGTAGGATNDRSAGGSRYTGQGTMGDGRVGSDSAKGGPSADVGTSSAGGSNAATQGAKPAR